MDASDDPLCVGIIDDESFLTEVYVKAFTRRGINISFVAHDGARAVELFLNASPRPSVLLMDQRMPGMSGIEAANRIRQIDPRVRVIFVSADAEAREEAFRSGAAGFIKKPASIYAIIEAVKKAV